MDKRNFTLNMNLACSKDDLRPVLQHVYFDSGFMLATEGHILVKAAVQHFSHFDKSEVDTLNGKFIHKNTFKKIIACEQVIITENGVQDLATKDVYAFSNVEQKYPNFDSVIPTKVEAIESIGINPKIAATLMKVLSNPEITTIKLEFSGVNKGIKITTPGYNEGTIYCVLMPAALEG
jgi:hypothetical protein